MDFFFICSIHFWNFSANNDSDNYSSDDEIDDDKAAASELNIKDIFYQFQNGDSNCKEKHFARVIEHLSDNYVWPAEGGSRLIKVFHKFNYSNNFQN